MRGDAERQTDMLPRLHQLHIFEIPDLIGAHQGHRQSGGLGDTRLEECPERWERLDADDALGLDVDVDSLHERPKEALPLYGRGSLPKELYPEVGDRWSEE